MINNYKFRQILQIIYAKIKTLKGGIVMGYLSEYLQKINTHQWGIIQLKEELKKLVKEYNKLKETQLLVYTAAIGKNIPGVAIEQNDFYFINDILKDYRGNKLDIYLETPGGSGEATEEIVRWLRKKYQTINFLEINRYHQVIYI